MMPRLTYLGDGWVAQTLDWPEDPSQDAMRADTSLFSGRAPFRRMIVVADDDAIPKDSTFSRDWLLAGFLTHPLIELFRYGDDGPPVSTPKRQYGEWWEMHEGWAVLGQISTDDGPLGTSQELALGGSRRPIHTSIFGEWAMRAKFDTTSNSYREMDDETAALARERDLRAWQVATVTQADFFLTTRPYVHEIHHKFGSGVTPVNPEDALPLISLYLRSQGLHLTYKNPNGPDYGSMNRGLFFRVGARELLPASWRWIAACAQHSNSSQDDRIIVLAYSLVTRVQRALQARDAVHQALNRRQNRDTADDALNSLDNALLLLMGAIDTAAQVAHITLGLTDNLHTGWQHGWIKAVRAKAPNLADVVNPQTDNAHTLSLLSNLRNSIHGEAMWPMKVTRSGARDTILVRLPRQSLKEIVHAIKSLDGPDLWSVDVVDEGAFYVDPGTLIEHLFPRVMGLLNDLMDQTPVDKLSGVQLAPSDLIPPGQSPGGYAEKERLSVRWQLGF